MNKKEKFRGVLQVEMPQMFMLPFPLFSFICTIIMYIFINAIISIHYISSFYGSFLLYFLFLLYFPFSVSFPPVSSPALPHHINHFNWYVSIFFHRIMVIYNYIKHKFVYAYVYIFTHKLHT